MQDRERDTDVYNGLLDSEGGRGWDEKKKKKKTIRKTNKQKKESEKHGRGNLSCLFCCIVAKLYPTLLQPHGL